MSGGEAIDLITGSGRPAQGGPPTWLVVAACFALAASVGAIIALVRRRTKEEDLSEWAYRVLARKIGLSRRDAATLRLAAGRAGVPASAALVCERAFARVREADNSVAPIGATLGFG